MRKTVSVILMLTALLLVGCSNKVDGHENRIADFGEQEFGSIEIKVVDASSEPIEGLSVVTPNLHIPEHEDAFSYKTDKEGIVKIDDVSLHRRIVEFQITNNRFFSDTTPSDEPEHTIVADLHINADSTAYTILCIWPF